MVPGSNVRRNQRYAQPGANQIEEINEPLENYDYRIVLRSAKSCLLITNENEPRQYICVPLAVKLFFYILVVCSKTLDNFRLMA